MGWMHQEVSAGHSLPLLEAYGVVRSLSLAMHGGQAMVMPLLQLKEFDQYTTTHSMNVSVLAMSLGEFLGAGAHGGAELRPGGAAARSRQGEDPAGDPGQAGQAHARGADGGRGASRPTEPGSSFGVTSRWTWPRSWPTSITATTTAADIPACTTTARAHHASRLVHVCDVYDALRTRRPYRDAWSSTEALDLHPGAGPARSSTPRWPRTFIEMMRRWDDRIALQEIA